MRRSTEISLGAATVVVLDLAVAVEAFRTDRPAIGTIAVLAALAATTVLVRARRPTIELRADLAAWTSRTAAATGEPESAIVQRAITRHRAALDGEHVPEDRGDHG